MVERHSTLKMGWKTSRVFTHLQDLTRFHKVCQVNVWMQELPKGRYDTWASYQDQPFPRNIGSFQDPNTFMCCEGLSFFLLAWIATFRRWDVILVGFMSKISVSNFYLPMKLHLHPLRQVTKRGQYITNPGAAPLKMGNPWKLPYIPSSWVPFHDPCTYHFQRKAAITKSCLVFFGTCGKQLGNAIFPKKTPSRKRKSCGKRMRRRFFFFFSLNFFENHIQNDWIIQTTLEGCIFFKSKNCFFFQDRTSSFWVFESKMIPEFIQNRILKILAGLKPLKNTVTVVYWELGHLLRKWHYTFTCLFWSCPLQANHLLIKRKNDKEYVKIV